MQKEYDLTKTSIHTAIHDFLSTNGATIVNYVANDTIVISLMSNKFNVVIKEITENSKKYDLLFLIPKYDSSKSIIDQESALVGETEINKVKCRFLFAGVLYDDSVGVLECNMLSDSMMFSTIDTRDIIRKTQHMFVGELNNKYLNPTDCIFYGGSSSVGADKDGNILVSFNKGELQVALYMDMDNLPTAGEHYDHWSSNIELDGVLITVNRLVISVTPEYLNKSLPTYFVMNSPKLNLYTKNHNTCNGITLCLPILFFVQREPRALDTYSAVGSTNIITFVDMFNMSSGRIIQTSYPIEMPYYQCFPIYKRRSVDGIVGYSGIAFLQGDKVNTDSSTSTETETSTGTSTDSETGTAETGVTSTTDTENNTTVNS